MSSGNLCEELHQPQEKDQVDIRYVKKDVYAIILKKGSNWQGVYYRVMNMVLYEKGTFKEVLEDFICFSSDNWANSENDSPYFPIRHALRDQLT